MYRCIKKRRPLNTHDYSLCFTVKNKLGPWDLKRLVWHSMGKSRPI